MRILVDPQPTWIENSGRWYWPLPDHAIAEGCSESVVSASREWWEYTPQEVRPRPEAIAVYEYGSWYWEFGTDKETLEEALRKTREAAMALCGLSRKHLTHDISIAIMRLTEAESMIQEHIADDFYEILEKARSETERREALARKAGLIP